MAATGDFGTGSGPGGRWRPVLAVVLGALAVAAVIIGALVLRDGADEPTAGGDPTTPDPGRTTLAEPGPTPSATPSDTPSSTPTPSITPSITPSVTPSPSSTPAAVKLTPAMLLTGADLNRADPGRGWDTGGEIQPPICGLSSTVAPGAVQTLTRQFGTDLDASGGQWVTSYKSPADATAAYRTLVAAIGRCRGLTPSPTHARKLTEIRAVAAGDATTILRWYDYPKPNDPGSEDGGFPHAITRSGSVVSVIVFREMGRGIAVPRFERLARAAAGHLPR